MIPNKFERVIIKGGEMTENEEDRDNKSAKPGTSQLVSGVSTSESWRRLTARVSLRFEFLATSLCSQISTVNLVRTR